MQSHGSEPFRGPLAEPRPTPVWACGLHPGGRLPFTRTPRRLCKRPIWPLAVPSRDSSHSAREGLK